MSFLVFQLILSYKIRTTAYVNTSYFLYLRWQLLFFSATVDVRPNTNSRTQQNQRPHSSTPKFWHTARPCLHRQSHSVPLSKDGLSGSSPLSRPSQTILVWCSRAKYNIQSQLGISHQQFKDLGFGSDHACNLIHIADVVHLNGVSLTGDVPDEDSQEEKIWCLV